MSAATRRLEWSVRQAPSGVEPPEAEPIIESVVLSVSRPVPGERAIARLSVTEASRRLRASAHEDLRNKTEVEMEMIGGLKKTTSRLALVAAATLMMGGVATAPDYQGSHSLKLISLK